MQIWGLSLFPTEGEEFIITLQLICLFESFLPEVLSPPPREMEATNNNICITFTFLKQLEEGRVFGNRSADVSSGWLVPWWTG